MNVQQIIPLGIVFVVIAIVLAFGSQILDDLQDQQTTSSYAYNVTGKGLESLQTFSNWLPTMALVIVASVIIGILVTYLWVRRAA